MTNDPFISYLCGLAEREDRGALARLRRGLGKEPGTCVEMCPYVFPWVSPNASTAEQNAYFLVASLFALHPNHESEAKSLGQTLRRVDQADGDAGKGIERRFVALLNARAEDLPGHLRHAVALAKSKSVPVNYALLHQHIRHWGHRDRWVQRKWAHDFWTWERQKNESEAPSAEEGN